MLDCLILGDSIAVGVGQSRPACVTAARVGITSGAFLQALYPGAPKAASHVVISLGVNDDGGMDTAGNLRRLRGGISAGRVTWLLPGLKDSVRHQVRAVAAERGDAVVDTISQVGPDHLHPGADGYRQIASLTERGGVAGSGGGLGAAPGAGPGTGSGVQRFASGPLVIRMPDSNPRRAGLLPQVLTPGSIYGAVATGPFAAIPPRDYAFRAFAPAN